MAKDPAVLLYTSDFLTGTMGWEDEQVGKYIRLLCLQHQKSNLPAKIFEKLSGGDPFICEKFITEEIDGNLFYYNEKMRTEAERRSAFCNSRRKNASGDTNDNHMDKHMLKHKGKHTVKRMETETETETITEVSNKNKEKNFEKIPPVYKWVITRAEEMKYPEITDQVKRFYDYYESNGWKVGKNPMKNWAAALSNWYKNYNQFNKNGKQNRNGQSEQVGRSADIIV